MKNRFYVSFLSLLLSASFSCVKSMERQKRVFNNNYLSPAPSTRAAQNNQNIRRENPKKKTDGFGEEKIAFPYLSLKRFPLNFLVKSNQTININIQNSFTVNSGHVQNTDSQSYKRKKPKKKKKIDKTETNQEKTKRLINEQNLNRKYRKWPGKYGQKRNGQHKKNKKGVTYVQMGHARFLNGVNCNNGYVCEYCNRHITYKHAFLYLKHFHNVDTTKHISKQDPDKLYFDSTEDKQKFLNKYGKNKLNPIAKILVNLPINNSVSNNENILRPITTLLATSLKEKQNIHTKRRRWPQDCSLTNWEKGKDTKDPLRRISQYGDLYIYNGHANYKNSENPKEGYVCAYCSRHIHYGLARTYIQGFHKADPNKHVSQQDPKKLYFDYETDKEQYLKKHFPHLIPKKKTLVNLPINNLASNSNKKFSGSNFFNPRNYNKFMILLNQPTYQYAKTKKPNQPNKNKNTQNQNETRSGNNKNILGKRQRGQQDPFENQRLYSPIVVNPITTVPFEHHLPVKKRRRFNAPGR